MNKLVNYNPLPKELCIRDSFIHGIGIFLKEDINPDVHFYINYFENIKQYITHIVIKRINSCDELSIKKIYRSPLGGFINHSTNPNCTMRKQDKPIISGDYEITEYYLDPLRLLKKDEEVTINYLNEECGSDYESESNLWLKS
jgi:hypothetical protein